METNKGILKALVEVMKGLPAIGKDSKNKSQGWNFRGYDAIYNHLQKQLAKQGIVIAYDMTLLEHTTTITKTGSMQVFWLIQVLWTLTKESDGSTMRSQTLGEALDYGDKGLSKAMTNAAKNLWVHSLCIATEDLKDPDEEAPQIEAVVAAQEEVAAAPAEMGPGQKAYLASKELLTNTLLPDDLVAVFKIDLDKAKVAKDTEALERMETRIRKQIALLIARDSKDKPEVADANES